MGVGFLPLRLLSFVSSLGAFALLAALLRRETGSWRDGAVAAGLFAATFSRSGGWLDLARLDSFYVLVLLGAVFALRHSKPWVAGLLIAGAFFTKQSALVVVVPVLAWLFFVERRRAAWAAGVAALSIAAGVFFLERSSGGWFGYYCFTLPAHHPRLPEGGGCSGRGISFPLFLSASFVPWLRLFPAVHGFFRSSRVRSSCPPGRSEACTARR
jgi:hypothetical protein